MMTVLGETVGQSLGFARDGIMGFERKVTQLDKRAAEVLKGARAKLEEARGLVPRRVESLGSRLTSALRGVMVTRGEFTSLVAKVDALADRVEAVAKRQRKQSAHA